MKAADEDEVVRMLRALGDARRFRMVREVAAAGELSCGELGSRFALSQPTISHHLKILLDAGLVVARPAGQHHYLSVDRERLRQLAGLLPERLAPRARRKHPSKRGKPKLGRFAA